VNSAFVEANPKGAGSAEAESDVPDIKASNDLGVERLRHGTAQASEAHGPDEAKPQEEVTVVKTKGCFPVQAAHQLGIQGDRLRRG